MTEIAADQAAPTVVTTDAGPTLQGPPDLRFHGVNRQVDWDSFDPAAYWEHNYRILRNDDQAIIQAVGEFFSQHFRNSPQPQLLRALDLGSAGNLYPALAMLPWAGTLTLSDVSAANLAWLRAVAPGRAGPPAEDDRGRWVWQPFWAEYARYPGYQQVADPRGRLAGRHEVRRLDVLELERAGWDLGTMFFVAESMTSEEDEFRRATRAFLEALVPGAPFAAAFMDSPAGYVVAGRAFPAVRSVDPYLVEEVLAPLTAGLSVARVDVPAHDPVNDGYEGMIVATGTRSAR